jgi:hypothetical protein
VKPEFNTGGPDSSSIGRMNSKSRPSLASGIPARRQSLHERWLRFLHIDEDRPQPQMAELHEVARMLVDRFPLWPPKLLQDAAEDVLAHIHFRANTNDGGTQRTGSSACMRNKASRPHHRDLPEPRLIDADGRDTPCRARRMVMDRLYFSLGSMTKVDEREGGEDPKELLARILEKRRWRNWKSTT